MSRNLTQAVQNELKKQNVRPVIFVQAQFTTGTIYVWSGIGSITWNGHAWIGLGELGKISPIGETVQSQAKGVQLQLSGVPSSLLTDALAEIQINYPCTIWVGFMDGSGNVIATPEKRFSGTMDAASIIEGSETSTITINVESKLVDLGRSRERRYTHQDQSIDYPGDNGFMYVAGIQELQVVWGRPGSAVSNLPPSTGGSGSGSAGNPGAGPGSPPAHTGGGGRPRLI